MSRSFLNVGSARLGATNNVVIATTSTAVASTAFASNTYQIRIACSAPVSYLVGDGTPTATATSPYLPNTWVDYVSVNPGQKVSVFSATIQTVSVTEVAG